MKGKKEDGKWTYVFIDEVQMCRKVLQPGVKLRDIAPEDRQDAYITFYDILNSLRKKPNVDVYVTGSNSKLLSKDVATNFRDRGVEIRLHPFSFAEYLQATEYADKSEALSAYMIWGGMPVAVMEADDVARAEYLKSLFSKVYIKDIIERNHLRTDAICESVLDVVSSSVGSLTNPNKLANTINSRGVLKTAEPTVKTYLDYFVDSFLFAKAARYEVRGRKYLLYMAMPQQDGYIDRFARAGLLCVFTTILKKMKYPPCAVRRDMVYYSPLERSGVAQW